MRRPAPPPPPPPIIILRLPCAMLAILWLTPAVAANSLPFERRQPSSRAQDTTTVVLASFNESNVGSHSPPDAFQQWLERSAVSPRHARRLSEGDPECSCYFADYGIGWFYFSYDHSCSCQMTAWAASSPPPQRPCTPRNQASRCMLQGPEAPHCAGPSRPPFCVGARRGKYMGK